MFTRKNTERGPARARDPHIVTSRTNQGKKKDPADTGPSKRKSGDNI